MTNVFKKAAWITTLACALPTATMADVLITEYVEGGSSNKAIEITNLGSDTVDLGAEQYKLALYSNGKTEEGNSLLLTGTLPPNASFVVYNAQASAEFVFPAPNGIDSTVTYFNGNDAIVLTKAGSVVDSFGRVGEDPGSEWTDANNAEFGTKDKTLRRKASVTAGDTTTDDAFPGETNQWVVLAKDTADGLGCPGEGACANDNNGDTPENSILITEYIEGGSSNKAIEISNLGNENVDLAAAGYKLTAYNNGGTSPGNSIDLYGILVPNSSLIIYNGGATDEFKFDAPRGIASTVTYFNGNDALVLTKNGAVVDSLGRVGEDPGEDWTDANDAEFSTKDKTLRRKSGIVVGDTIIDDAFPGATNQWTTFAKDTADGLGCIGEVACDGTEPLPLPAEGDDDGSGQTGLCLNCPEITKIADASTYQYGDFYAQAIDAEAEQLRSVLNTIASSGHQQLTYSEVWSVLTHSDQDPANPDNVIEIYTGKSIAKWSNGSGEQSSDPDAWNREHVWPKSHGFPDRSQMAYTDAHHLRPADASMNSTRSNYDFDVGGIPVDEAQANSIDSEKRTFEPRDEMKGDVARMAFYMDLRYNGAASDNTPNLTLVNRIGTVSGDPELGKLCTLYEWHLVDQVDSFEQNRNNVVYEYQGNRNPFIDNPQWVEDLYGSVCGPNTAPVINIDSAIAVATGTRVIIDASGSTDAEGDTLTYQWKQLTSELIHFDAFAATLTFQAPNVGTDTPIKFELTVSDGTNFVTETVTVVVESEENGGSMGWLIIGLVAALGILRKYAI